MAKITRNIYRSLKASKIRFLMIAFVISVGITSFDGMVMSFINLNTTYTSAFEEHNMASFTIQTANPKGPGEDAWMDYANVTQYLQEFNANHNQEIENYELRLIYDLNFEINGKRQNGRIVAFNTTYENGSLRDQPDVNGYRLLSGSGFDETSKLENVTLVEAHLADYWGLKENDIINVGDNNVPFQVKGTLASPEYLLNTGSYEDILPSPRRFGVIFVPLRTAQQLLGVPDKINEISVIIKSDSSFNKREEIAKDLKEFLEIDHGLFLGAPIDRDFQVSFYLLRLDMEEAREIGYVLPIIILGMAMGGLYILLGRMVVSERKDIAVSQALGYSRRFIIMQYVGIALVVSIVGTIMGTVIGLAFADAFIPLYVEAIGIKFPSYIVLDWGIIFVGIILGILTGLVGGYLPVRNAIQPIPAESLRYDPSLHITSGKIPLFERILKKMRISFKVTGLKFPIRNFFRSKKRSFSSIIGVVIAVSLISMGFGMVESMTGALETQYEVAEDWDLKVDYSEMPGNISDIITTLNNFDDVKSTYHFTSGTTITSSKSNVEKTVQLIGLKNTDNYLGHKFVFEAGDYDPDGVVLTVPIAEKLNVWVGDNVELEILNLTEIISFSPLKIRFELINVTYKISGIIDEFNGLVAYVDLVKLKTVSNFPDDPANSVLLQIDNPTEERLEEIRTYIYEDLDYNVRIISTKEETIGDLLGLLNILYYLMYALAAFSVLLAVAMVYNTVYINLEERKREMATLLTIGTPSRSIVKNVTLENFIVTVIGSILGIILGYLLLVFFMEIILDIEFFRIKSYISYTTMFVSFVLTLIGVLVAQFFPLRRILNLNLAEATKERVV